VETLNFDERPILVFWESTRACLLACKHCRAEAMEKPLPGELTTEEGFRFIESLRSFGRPYPVLIITGGDVLMREDAFELVASARQLDIPVALAPSVTRRLTDDVIKRMATLGVKAVSISLDGATASTHEDVRGIPGHFDQTIGVLRSLVAHGFQVQVNTTVMKRNVQELPALVELLKQMGIAIWEVFFLIEVGRGKMSMEISAAEYEDVLHFLFDASTYELTVRAVEAPFFRRVVLSRNLYDHGLQATPAEIADTFHLGPLYRQLAHDLRRRLGHPWTRCCANTRGTRDGKGIIFVGYDGTVYPAGFLPVPLGNIRRQSLVDIYRGNPVLRDIRAGRFTGKCGVCEYRDICGGSRSRAFARTGDPLATDPACLYEPSQDHAGGCRHTAQHM
jgi:radical SAM protein